MTVSASALVPPSDFVTRIGQDHYEAAAIGGDPEFGYLQAIFYNQSLFEPIVLVWEAAKAYVKSDGRFDPGAIQHIDIRWDESVIVHFGAYDKVFTTLRELLPPSPQSTSTTP